MVIWYFSSGFVRLSNLTTFKNKTHYTNCTMKKRLLILICLIIPLIYACEDQAEEIVVETIQEEKSDFATMSASMGAAMRAGNEINIPNKN